MVTEVGKALDFTRSENTEGLVPGKAIEKLEAALLNRSIKIHGYMLLSGKNIVAEKYFPPYKGGELHRSYSVTKSFVALAVGCLIKNKLVKLSDHIVDYYKDYLPDSVHPWLLETTIEDMLRMCTCYSKTTYKDYDDENWTRTFFNKAPDHIPGTVFAYDTSAAHVLGDLTERLTGMSFLDYLRKEAFDRIGFSKDAYTIIEDSGMSQGGSGTMCTLEDMAKAAYLCSHGGVYEGEELIPQEFIALATAKLTPTAMQNTEDEQAGYGYFIWMPRIKRNEGVYDETGKMINDTEGFVFYGMGGQLAVAFPDKDFIYLTIADTIGNPAGLQILYDAFYNNIYPYVKGMPDIPLKYEKPDLSAHRGFCYELKTRESYEFYENINNIRKISFEPDRDSFKLYYIPNKADVFGVFGTDPYDNRLKAADYDKESPIELEFIYDGKEHLFPGTGYSYICSLKRELTHYIVYVDIFGEELGTTKLDIAWKDDERLSVNIKSTNLPFTRQLNGYLSARKI